MIRTFTSVTILGLRLPGNWIERLASENVKRLALSGEILQPPAIRNKDQSVIWGADRLAAMHLRGDVEAQVWNVVCSEDEAAELRDIENACRREPDMEARSRLLALWEAKLSKPQEPTTQPVNSLHCQDITSHANTEQQPTESKRKPGRPPTIKGEARSAVAAAAGVSKNALEAQASRETAQAEPETRPALPSDDIAEALNDIIELLAKASRGVTALAKLHPELTERFDVQGVKWKLQKEVIAAFQGMRPFATCVYCKAHPKLLANCVACVGSGWITETQSDAAPAELQGGAGIPVGVYVDGKFVTLDELDAPKKAAKKLTVVMPADAMPAFSMDSADDDVWGDTE